MVKVTEASFDITNLIRITLPVILAINPAFPLRIAVEAWVVASLVDVARLDHRIWAIGETEVGFRIAPEISRARIIRITRTQAILMKHQA